VSARCARRFEVRGIPTGGRHTLVLTGELDIASAPELDVLTHAICSDGTTGIALDLRNLAFIDCCGLRSILRIRELCARRGCEFTMTRGTDAVSRVFALTGLADELPFQRDGLAPPTMVGEPWKIGAPASRRALR
jgi:anti-sigma B factor antagonist